MLLQVAGVAGFEDQIMFGKGDLEGDGCSMLAGRGGLAPFLLGCFWGWGGWGGMSTFMLR